MKASTSASMANARIIDCSGAGDGPPRPTDVPPADDPQPGAETHRVFLVYSIRHRERSKAIQSRA